VDTNKPFTISSTSSSLITSSPPQHPHQQQHTLDDVKEEGRDSPQVISLYDYFSMIVELGFDLFSF